jgi:antitoxin (DNA-binding transcriptional repressor) of toxin-antitoxin stability system
VKTIDIQKTTLASCVRDAQSERILITHDGDPVALIVGLDGLDEEQIQLGASDRFWNCFASVESGRTLRSG